MVPLHASSSRRQVSPAKEIHSITNDRRQRHRDNNSLASSSRLRDCVRRKYKRQECKRHFACMEKDTISMMTVLPPLRAIACSRNVCTCFLVFARILNSKCHRMIVSQNQQSTTEPVLGKNWNGLTLGECSVP